MVDIDEIRRQYQAYMVLKHGTEDRAEKNLSFSELTKVIRELPEGSMLIVDVGEENA